MSIFEISKVPLWVNAEDMIAERITQMCWVTEFVQLYKSFGGNKSFLVRANMEPPKGCVRAGEHMMLIQPAKPIPMGKISVSYFEGKVPNTNHKNKDLGKNFTVPTRRKILLLFFFYRSANLFHTKKTSFGGPEPKRRKSVP